MKTKFGETQSLMLARLMALNDSLEQGPWKADVIENIGDNWNIATMGRSSIDDKDYILTTDRVRASECRGDSKTDAEGIAELRNMLPRIIEFLFCSANGEV